MVNAIEKELFFCAKYSAQLLYGYPAAFQIAP